MAVPRRLFRRLLIFAFLAFFIFSLLEQKKAQRARIELLRKLLKEEKLKMNKQILRIGELGREISDACNRSLKQNVYTVVVSQACGDKSGDPPMIFKRLPHLVTSTNALKPIIVHQSIRSGVWMVMGMSTVMRRKSYLIRSVRSVIENIHQDDIKDCLLVVQISEISSRNFTSRIYWELKESFQTYLDSGMLEVIAVPEEFYPPLTNMTPAFNDTSERVAWRTKQNLDYIFLMMYCMGRGTYYLQLEDDIAAYPEYTRVIRYSKNLQLDWFILEFSRIGFIGKLFNKKSIATMIEFLVLFYDDKPCDWLLHHVLEVNSGCTIIKGCKLKRHYPKRSLFQHLGFYSSLEGKIQKIRASDFGKISDPVDKVPSKNPPATLSSTFKSSKGSALHEVYKFKGTARDTLFFWAQHPVHGDNITIAFTPPVCLSSYRFTSGNSLYPFDTFDSVDLLVRTSGSTGSGSFRGFRRIDGVSGSAGETRNVLEGKLGPSYGLVSEMVLLFISKSEYWILINEINIEPCLVTEQTR